MTRQRYETSSDLSNEQDAIDRFASYSNVDYKKMPPGSHFDYAILERGGKRIKGFAEIKCRNIRYGQYPDIMLSWHKLVAADSIGVPVVLLVRWSDRIGWAYLDSSLWATLEWGGRTKDTRDEWDVEPIIKIKNELFTLIER